MDVKGKNNGFGTASASEKALVVFCSSSELQSLSADFHLPKHVRFIDSCFMLPSYSHLGLRLTDFLYCS